MSCHVIQILPARQCFCRWCRQPSSCWEFTGITVSLLPHLGQNHHGLVPKQFIQDKAGSLRLVQNLQRKWLCLLTVLLVSTVWCAFNLRASTQWKTSSSVDIMCGFNGLQISSRGSLDFEPRKNHWKTGLQWKKNIISVQFLSSARLLNSGRRINKSNPPE